MSLGINASEQKYISDSEQRCKYTGIWQLLFNRNAQSTPPSAITVITAQMWGFQVISNSFHLLAGIFSLNAFRRLKCRRVLSHFFLTWHVAGCYWFFSGLFCVCVTELFILGDDSLQCVFLFELKRNKTVSFASWLDHLDTQYNVCLNPIWTQFPSILCNRMSGHAHSQHGISSQAIQIILTNNYNNMWDFTLNVCLFPHIRQLICDVL